MVKEKNLPDSLPLLQTIVGKERAPGSASQRIESEEITGTGEIKERRVPVLLGADRPGFFLTAPGY